MAPVEFLLQILELNEISRTGWEVRGVDEPQRVAGHTWGVAFLTLLFAPEEPEVDDGKAVKIALIHDLAEVIVGDIVVHETYGTMTSEEKEQLERQAMEDLAASAAGFSPFDELYDLWHEYENRSSPEAKFVKDMDLVEVCLFALKYEMESRYDPTTIEGEPFPNLEGFFATAADTVSSDIGVSLIQQIKAEYDDLEQRT